MDFLVAITAFPPLEVGACVDRTIAHSGEFIRYDTKRGREGQIVGADS